MTEDLSKQQVRKLSDFLESGIEKCLDENAKADLIKGPDEITLVRSGLEDTMREAYQEIKEMHYSNPKIHDRRTVAFKLLQFEKLPISTTVCISKKSGI